MRRGLFAVLLAVIAVAAACGGKKGTNGYDLTLSGTVVDWRSGQPVPQAALRSVGILPQRTAESDDQGRFVLRDIPINGYVIVDISAVGHIRTIAPAILVAESDVSGLVLPVIAAADAAA